MAQWSDYALDLKLILNFLFFQDKICTNKHTRLCQIVILPNCIWKPITWLSIIWI